MQKRVPVAILLMALCAATPGALQKTIDYDSIDEAIALGRRGSAAARARFHDGYRQGNPQQPVDFVEIVSPFRRVVIAAQQAAEAGDIGFGQRRALDILRTAGARLDVRVEMTFHPQNTFIGVPLYNVFLSGEGNRRVAPKSIDRLSRWTPRLDGLPPALPAGGDSGPSRGRPLLGGTLVASFDLESIEAEGFYDVVVSEASRELAKVRIDLKRLR